MIIKDKDYKYFIQKLEDYHAFLIYGPDKGKVKENSNNIIKRLMSKTDFNVIKLSEEDLEKNSLVDLIFQKNIFANKSIIRIDLDFFPKLKLNDQLLSSISSSKTNILLLEAGNLKKNHYLVKSFNSMKELACIACYHENLSSLKETIKIYSEKFNLKIDPASISYLSEKLGNDKLLTLQEMKKLSIYGNGKNVTYIDVLNSVGDSSLISINKVCDNLYTSNKASYFYDKIVEQGFNYMIVLRSLLNHFYLLLSFKESNKLEYINFPPSIHFSRHESLRKQIRLLSKKEINNIISSIYNLEEICKKEYRLANLLIKKFLVSCSKN